MGDLNRPDLKPGPLTMKDSEVVMGHVLSAVFSPSKNGFFQSPERFSERGAEKRPKEIFSHGNRLSILKVTFDTHPHPHPKSG